jgi:hypothetical protein
MLGKMIRKGRILDKKTFMDPIKSNIGANQLLSKSNTYASEKLGNCDFHGHLPTLAVSPIA